MANEMDEMLSELEKIKPGAKASMTWAPPSDKEGTYPIRILPELKKTKGEKLFVFRHMVHWLDGSPIECINQNLVDKNGNLHEAEECPLCAKSKRLYKIAEEKSPERDMAYELSAKEKYVMRVVVRGKEDETVPEFYEAGKKVFGMIYHYIKETDFGNITHPNTGRDFIINKKGVKRLSNYDNSTVSANASPIFKDAAKMKTLLENANKLEYSTLIEFKSQDAVQKILTAYLEGDSQEEELLPARPAPVARPAPAVARPAPATARQTSRPAPAPVAEAVEEEVSVQSEDPVSSILDEIDF